MLGFNLKFPLKFDLFSMVYGRIGDTGLSNIRNWCFLSLSSTTNFRRSWCFRS
ncbi:hypothetical protein RchiOBHm_Chr2g0089841 [Rosa chinensis]|uniref:Uncharacterized protein n=1 Tax=Rosa chinensis TaxID=74649 RepID=A0A2P6RJB1_ROSCH|nr:hypothetical protein RchiOBHm_Chr2g0089841 [Rosa chinensis]